MSACPHCGGDPAGCTTLCCADTETGPCGEEDCRHHWAVLGWRQSLPGLTAGLLDDAAIDSLTRLLRETEERALKNWAKRGLTKQDIEDALEQGAAEAEAFAEHRLPWSLRMKEERDALSLKLMGVQAAIEWWDHDHIDISAPELVRRLRSALQTSGSLAEQPAGAAVGAEQSAPVERAGSSSGDGADCPPPQGPESAGTTTAELGVALRVLANPAAFAPPWVIFADRGKSVAIMPAGRPGDVALVRSLSDQAVQAIVMAANAALETRAVEAERWSKLMASMQKVSDMLDTRKKSRGQKP
jgi:hypothetical protein